MYHQLITICIQHAPLAGDEDEWIMDVQVNDKSLGSWKARTKDALLDGLPELLKKPDEIVGKVKK